MRKKLTVGQKKFVEGLLLGKSQKQAYIDAGYKAKHPTNASHTLAQKDFIQAEIEKRMKPLKDKVDFTRIDMANYWIDILKTPIGEVDMNHRLCQEYNYTATEDVEKTQVKMPSKTEAGKALTALMGWNEPEKKELSLDDPIMQILKDIRNG